MMTLYMLFVGILSRYDQVDIIFSSPYCKNTCIKIGQLFLVSIGQVYINYEHFKLLGCALS